MRLDKYVASTTEFSRSEVKRLIKSGHITINNICADDPGMHVSAPEDIVRVNDIAVAPPQSRYFMLHKPLGYVCSTQDSENPIVLDLLEERNKSQLQIAGRLDKETSGLILITDNGQWNHRVTSPNRNCYKHYQVKLARPLLPELVEKFKQGIMLNNEKRPTLPAKLVIESELHAELIIQEGKYHQVRRMFAAVGNHVTSLHRSRIGKIVLDPILQPGDYRLLTQEEVDHFA
jgi:16S rRNA pseudouridine516 synthase